MDHKVVFKFFSTVGGYLSVRHLTTTAYHSQTHDQAKQFGMRIVNRLSHNVAEHHTG